ncbi:hypothetical protein Q1695_000114 [Nippostrongylus brasiliensis]|nr:hypothetical protein Q1695_000114 [Nippostrongylus brasiliensis]
MGGVDKCLPVTRRWNSALLMLATHIKRLFLHIWKCTCSQKMVRGYFEVKKKLCYSWLFGGRTKLGKKSATLIAWQSAYDELKEKYKRLKSRLSLLS